MATKAEKDHMRRAQELGCLACNQLGHYSVAELHHPKSGDRRIGWATVIPLCPAHHRSVEHDEAIHGPSLAKSPKRFRERFGSDDYLLAIVAMRLSGDNDNCI